MARGSAYLEAGLFEPRFDLVPDVDMWMRLAEHYDVAYIAEPPIGWPSTEALPNSREGVVAAEKLRNQIERIFRETRIRHFHGRPTRLRLELAQHRALIARVRAYYVGSVVKVWLRRVAGKGDRAHANVNRHKA
jgi:hypothetical protein